MSDGRLWHRETLYGADERWRMQCSVCDIELGPGEEAWVLNDASGNGEFAACLSHGNPNVTTPASAAAADLARAVAAWFHQDLDADPGYWDRSILSVSSMGHTITLDLADGTRFLLHVEQAQGAREAAADSLRRIAKQLST